MCFARNRLPKSSGAPMRTTPFDLLRLSGKIALDLPDGTLQRFDIFVQSLTCLGQTVAFRPALKKLAPESAFKAGDTAPNSRLVPYWWCHPDCRRPTCAVGTGVKGLLYSEIGCLHLLVVCQLRTGAVHDHPAALQHVGSFHERKRAARVLLDQEDCRAHRVNLGDFLKRQIGNDGSQT